MPFIPINRGAGRLFDENLNRMLQELFLMLNQVDSTNSSDAELGVSEVFTGEWLDVSGFNSTMVAVSTDVNGSYAVQYSTDETNVDSTLTRYYRTNEINPPHRFTNTRQYMRVVYTNGTSAQTYFRMQVMVGDFTALNAPLDGTLSDDFDAIAVRPTDHDDEVVLGLRQGRDASLKFGFNDDVDTAAAEVIASFGGTFTPLSTASTMTFVSDDTNDTSAGSGARSLFVTGIDADRNYQFEFITMNGTTNVVSSNTWLGINRVVVFSVGTAQGSNAGNISVTATTGGSNQARIPAGLGVTQQAIFFNRDGYTSLIRKIHVNCLKLGGGGAPRITVRLNVWNPKVTNSTYVIRRIKMDAEVSNDLVRNFKPPLKLDPTDVMWLTVETDQNNTIVDAEIDIVEARNVAT